LDQNSDQQGGAKREDSAIKDYNEKHPKGPRGNPEQRPFSARRSWGRVLLDSEIHRRPVQSISVPVAVTADCDTHPSKQGGPPSIHVSIERVAGSRRGFTEVTEPWGFLVKEAEAGTAVIKTLDGEWDLQRASASPSRVSLLVGGTGRLERASMVSS